MTRALLALALCAAAGTAMSAERQYIYFCAGDPVPAWVEAVEGAAEMTFDRDAIVTVDDGEVIVYPARGTIESGYGVLSDKAGTALLSGIIRIRRSAHGRLAITGSPTWFRKRPPDSPPADEQRCG